MMVKGHLGRHVELHLDKQDFVQEVQPAACVMHHLNLEVFPRISKACQYCDRQCDGRHPHGMGIESFLVEFGGGSFLVKFGGAWV